jgi:hypothetical protein
MSKEYPIDYTGPRAGKSLDEEWLAVRDYQAYKWIVDGTWSYSDFDCYLYAMCREHYKKGGDSVQNALKDFIKFTTK